MGSFMPEKREVKQSTMQLLEEKGRSDSSQGEAKKTWQKRSEKEKDHSLAQVRKTTGGKVREELKKVLKHKNCHQ